MKPEIKSWVVRRRCSKEWDYRQWKYSVSWITSHNFIFASKTVTRDKVSPAVKLNIKWPEVDSRICDFGYS